MKHDYPKIGKLVPSHLLVLAALLLLTTMAHAQTTRYVDGIGVDSGDCTDESNPCGTITYAIDQANPGDTIQIAAGAYTESLVIDKTISLQGAGQDETIIQASTDAPGTPGEASDPVIRLGEGNVFSITDVTIRHGVLNLGVRGAGGIENRGSTLELANVTITRNKSEDNSAGMIFSSGASGTLTNVTVIQNEAVDSGGGLNFIAGTSATLSDVTISENVAGRGGGGLYTWSSESDPTDLELMNVTFSSNEAGRYGGGMYNTIGSSPTLTNVTFEGNVALGTGTGNGGGGMYNNDSSPTLKNVTFSGNEANRGGGMYNIDESSPELTDVLFEENVAGSGGGMMNESISSPVLLNVRFHGNEAAPGGGMVNLDNSSPTLTGVIFSGNAGTYGGGMYNSETSSPVLTNVTFGGNSAFDAGGGIFNEIDSAPVLSNVIIWNNAADGSTTTTSASIQNESSTPGISYSLIANSGGSSGWDPAVGTDGGNNLDQDPAFFDPVDPADAPTTTGNLRPTETSPVVDAGDPATDPGLFPLNESGDPVDLDGRQRFFGDEIDIGAYEWHPQIDVLFSDRFEMEG